MRAPCRCEAWDTTFIANLGHALFVDPFPGTYAVVRTFDGAKRGHKGRWSPELISGFNVTGDIYDGSVEGHNETRNLAGEKHLPCGTGCQPWQVGADLEANTRSAFWARSYPG